MTNTAETAIETLARVSKDIERASITEFYEMLGQIAAAIQSGNIEKARQWVGLSVRKIAGIYGLMFLEVPDWCPPSMSQELTDGIAALRKQIEIVKTVRQHEKQEQIEREAGNPPRAN